MDPENGPLDEAARRSRFLDGLTARFASKPQQASVEALGALLRRSGRFAGDASIDATGIGEFEKQLEKAGLAEALLRSPKLYAAWPVERPGFGFVPTSELEALLGHFQEPGPTGRGRFARVRRADRGCARRSPVARASPGHHLDLI